MKRIVLTLSLFIATFCTSQAQVWLGGSLNVQVDKGTQAFTIAPDLGYCFPDTPFSIGCTVEYEGLMQTNEAYSHSLTLSPFFRYDVCEIGERFSLFMDLAADIDILERSFFDVGLSPGVSFDLTEHWSAEFSCGFLGYEWEQSPSSLNQHRFVLDFATVAPSFGLYYNF